MRDFQRINARRIFCLYGSMPTEMEICLALVFHQLIHTPFQFKLKAFYFRQLTGAAHELSKPLCINTFAGGRISL